MYLPENGHTSGRNMYEVYVMYNMVSFTYVHLLVLISYPSFSLCLPFVHKRNYSRITGSLLSKQILPVLLASYSYHRDWRQVMSLSRVERVRLG
jgi:hypothetical protein